MTKTTTRTAPDIIRFWRHIYDSQRGLLQVWTAKRGADGNIDRETIAYQFFNYPGEAQPAAEWALEKAGEERDVYQCAHLLTQRRRIKENAASLRTLYAELDGGALPNGRYTPTAAVESSPGRFHVYYRLTDALPPETAERLNRRLAHVIGADPSGYDLSQLLRVPGTANHKYNGGGVPVRLLSLDGSRSYVPSELDAILPKLEEPVGGRAAEHEANGLAEPPVVLGDEALKVWRGEKPKAKDTGAVDRSASVLMIGRVLFDAGATRSVIISALEERDRALGWRKYTDRADAWARYADIVDELECNGRNHSASGPKKRRKNRKGGSAGESEVGETKMLADAVSEGNHFALDAGGKLYRYSGGTYRKGAEKYIRRRVKELLEEWERTDAWSSYRAEEVTKYIAADAPELWERPPADKINLLNGILDVFTRDLRNHSPDYLSPVQIPIRYEPEATCPQWERYVEPCFPDDARSLPYEIFASVITPYRATQKAVLLLGEGANGKSTYLAAVIRALGRANCTSVTLQALESNRFATARLVGRLANICADLPSTHLQETSVFKALTGDEGQITAEYKHKDSFEFEPYCQLVFSANHPPRSSDASHAFYRRWVVAPFERTFEEGEQLPREELDAKLSEPEELSGMLNRALDALPELRKHGFTESPKMRAAWEEFRAMTDPVSVWLGAHTVRNPNAYVSRADLHKAYNDWANDNHKQPLSMKAFGQSVKRAIEGITQAQKGTPPNRQWVWIGIGLKTSEPEPDPSRRSGTHAPDALDALDPSNCNEKADDPLFRGNDSSNIGGSGDLCNKGNLVHPVHPVHGPDSPDFVDLDRVEKATQALTYGNAPKKALEHYRDGNQDLDSVVRSVVYYYARKHDDFDPWRAATEAAIAHLDGAEVG